MLLLIKEPKCVFIHILKNGGTSITDSRGKKGVFKTEERCFEMPEEWKDLFKFTFVRNPYDRAVSAWFYSKRGAGNGDRTFSEFLELITDETLSYKDVKNYSEMIKHHTLPQTHPYYCLKHADFIGRFETYQEDFDKVCALLDVSKKTLPHLNKTKHQHYSTYYTEQTLAVVNDYYRNDFQELDYKVKTSL